jgi:hypothetical protein
MTYLFFLSYTPSLKVLNYPSPTSSQLREGQPRNVLHFIFDTSLLHVPTRFVCSCETCTCFFFFLIRKQTPAASLTYCFLEKSLLQGKYLVSVTTFFLMSFWYHVLSKVGLNQMIIMHTSVMTRTERENAVWYYAWEKSMLVLLKVNFHPALSRGPRFIETRIRNYRDKTVAGIFRCEASDNDHEELGPDDEFRICWMHHACVLCPSQCCDKRKQCQFPKIQIHVKASHYFQQINAICPCVLSACVLCQLQ